jgi:SDR family mycofactocin-dependent oxidoreductase
VSRVALVTGAARGIGAATVAALATDGWTVLAVDRASPDPRLPYTMGTRDELDAVARSTGATPFVGDATGASDMAAAVGFCEQELGGLEAVVVAAGVIAGGVPLWEVPIEQEQAVMEVDLGAVLVAARVGIPALLRMPEPRDGRFVAVASAAATRGLPMLAAYCAAKAGVTGLVRSLATELRGTGITANAVSPGSTATAILDESARLYDLDSAAAFARQQPLERLIEPKEVADAIRWLVSPAASAVTGIALPVDGGLAL